MGDVIEATRTTVAAEPARAQAAEPARVQTAGQAPGKRNFRFPSRRSQRPQTKAEVDATRMLIEDFIAKRGVTVCPPGYANGAVPTQYDFV
jgi:hypothetical protein